MDQKRLTCARGAGLAAAAPRTRSHGTSVKPRNDQLVSLWPTRSCPQFCLAHAKMLGEHVAWLAQCSVEQTESGSHLVGVADQC